MTGNLATEGAGVPTFGPFLGGAADSRLSCLLTRASGKTGRYSASPGTRAGGDNSSINIDKNGGAPLESPTELAFIVISPPRDFVATRCVTRFFVSSCPGKCSDDRATRVARERFPHLLPFFQRPAEVALDVARARRESLRRHHPPKRADLGARPCRIQITIKFAPVPKRFGVLVKRHSWRASRRRAFGRKRCSSPTFWRQTETVPYIEQFRKFASALAERLASRRCS